MNYLNWTTAKRRIIELLKQWMPEMHITVQRSSRNRSIPNESVGKGNVGIRLTAGGTNFNIQWKATSSTAELLHAIHYLKTDKNSSIPIVAVPFMGPTGKNLCEKERINWMDLSGNALIQAPGIHIHSIGNQNKFIRKGPKQSIFAPKSSRVIRYLLQNATLRHYNKQIAESTNVDPGHISRILDKLVEMALIHREDDGKYVLVNPDQLLAEWRTQYNFFEQNEVIKGHIPARNSESLVKSLNSILQNEKKLRFAFTGLAAAWQFNQWVTFRLITLYLDKHPSEKLLEKLTFRPETAGANTWIAIPKDVGVFSGTLEQNGITCVGKIQTYLDLKDHPERSKEAADELYQDLKMGENHG